jgi:hypothetical protein
MTAQQPDPVHRATAELTALAIAVRHDWPEHAVSGAIQQAGYEGMTWRQVLVSLPRLMADPDATPGELVPDSRQPLAPRAVLPPEETARYARYARECLAEALGQRAGAA